MTPFPYSVEEGQDAVAAVKMMDEHGIRHLPVTRQGRICGVISEADLRVALSLAPTGSGELRQTGIAIGAICTRDPYVVQLDQPLDEVVSEMAARQIGSALVLKGDKLAGILTATDVCRLLGDLLRETFPPPGSDQVA